MNAKQPFCIIRVFDYPRWPRSTLPRIIGIVLYRFLDQNDFCYVPVSHKCLLLLTKGNLGL
jgi:hypothetical protein